MFDHVMLRVTDRTASRRFYATVLEAIGVPAPVCNHSLDEWDEFAIAPEADGRPATTGLHIAFVTQSTDDVDAFWRAGTDAGFTSDGDPGPRPQYGEGYYGAFLLDPDGNSAEAVWLGRPRRGTCVIDHVWVRVADLARSRRFYETIAPGLGFRIDGDHPDRFHVIGHDRSFALVHEPGRVSANVHMAFPVARNADVISFHGAALAAGYTDNGAPGERANYHPGYYAAFVLDPDGNNIEVVNHNR